MAQHAADCFDIHTVLQGDGGEGVTEVVEPDFRDTCPFQHPFQHIVHTVRGDGTAVGGREHILVIGFPFLLPQDFDCLGRDPPNYGDADSVLGLLYECFNENNPYDSEQIKADFEELYRQTNGMPLREMDRIVYPVCKLCRDHERAGVVEGIKIGVRLLQELG